MAKTRAEIQAKSDAKRGVKAKTYKIPITLVNEIADLAKTHNISQGKVIAESVALFKAKFERKVVGNETPHQ